MYPILQHAHSGWRYLVLLIVSLTILKLLVGLLAKGKWKIWDDRLMIGSVILTDIQVLTGLLLIFMSGLWRSHIYMEHAAVMLIAAVLIHVGRRMSKLRRLDDAARFKRATICVASALLLMALGVYRITLGLAAAGS